MHYRLRAKIGRCLILCMAIVLCMWLSPESRAGCPNPNWSNSVLEVATDPGVACSTLSDVIIEANLDGSYTVTIIKDSTNNAAPFFGYLWTQPGVVLDEVKIQNDSTNTLRLAITGENASLLNAPLEIGAIRSIGTGSGLVEIIGLDCRGDVGDIEGNVLSTMTILGDLVGDISVTRTSNNAGGTWQGPNVIEGDILGDVFVEIRLVANATVSVRGSVDLTPPAAVRLNGGIGIGAVFEASEINARISAFNVAGRIRTTTDFGGSGDFNGDLRITNTLTKDGSVEIGGALGTNGRIRLLNDLGDCVATQGPIQGRISINHEGAVVPINAWLGEVRVNVTDFADPLSGTVIDEEYLTPACELGNGTAQDAIGSVGVAPFMLHLGDSVPAFNSNRVFTAAAEPADFELRHYGAIQLDVTPGVSVQLQRQAICDNQSPNW